MSSPPPEPPARARRWTTAAIAAGVFLLGLVAGGVVVVATGLAAGDSTVPVTGPQPGPTAVTSPRPAPSPSPQVLLAPACLRAFRDVQTVYQDVQDIGRAAGAFDAAALDRIVQRLQDVRTRLATEIPGCRAAVVLPSTSPAAPSDGHAPTGSPR